MHSHQEAISLFYAKHTFTIQSLPTLYQFLTQVPLTSLKYITTLYLTLTIPPTYLTPPPAVFYHGPDTAQSQWITATFILSRLPSLSSLKITIWNITYRRFQEDQMLLPLKAVRVQPGGSFLVCVPWQEPSSSPPSPSSSLPTTVNGVKMTILRRPRNHEPVIEPTFLETNVQIATGPTVRRRRKRRCSDTIMTWFSGRGCWGLLGFVCCCPMILLAYLWDLTVGKALEVCGQF